MKKRGQAALEFLTTYGWAFLVILVMIAALAYFGVLSPQNIVPDSCQLTTGFDCVDFQVTPTQTELLIINNLGRTIEVQCVPANGDGVSLPSGALVTDTCTVDSVNGNDAIVTDGERFTLTIETTDGLNELTVGDKKKVDFQFNYLNTGSTFDHLTVGAITTTVSSN